MGRYATPVSANQAEHWARPQGLFGRLEAAFQRSAATASREAGAPARRGRPQSSHRPAYANGRAGGDPDSTSSRKSQATAETQRRVNELITAGNWWRIAENAARPDAAEIERLELSFDQQAALTAAAAQHELRLAAAQADEAGGDAPAAINETAEQIRGLVSAEVPWSTAWNDAVTSLATDVAAESPQTRVTNIVLYEAALDAQQISQEPIITPDAAERRFRDLEINSARDFTAALEAEFDSALVGAPGATLAEQEAAARLQVLANHVDEGPDIGVSIDAILGEIIAQRDLLRQADGVDPGDREWVAAELAETDPLTTAIFDRLGIELTRTGLSEEEEAIAEQDPRLAGLLQYTGIKISTRRGITTVIILTDAGGTYTTRIDPRELNLQENPRVRISVEGQEVEFSENVSAQILDGMIPGEGEDSPNLLPLANALLATRQPDAALADLMRLGDAVRPQYTQQRTTSLMEQGKDEQAARLLTANLNAAFSLDSRNQIWEAAGQPIFDDNYFRTHLRDIERDHDGGMGIDYFDAIGDYLLEAGDYLPPEAAHLLLDETRSVLGDTPAGSDTAPFTDQLFTGLASLVEVADQLPDPARGGTRSEEFAEWLVDAAYDDSSPLYQVVGGIGSSHASDAYYATGGPDGGAVSLSVAIAAEFTSRNHVYGDSWTAELQEIGRQTQLTNNRAIYTDFQNNTARYTDNLFDKFLKTPEISEMRDVDVGPELTNLVGHAMGIEPTDTEAAATGDNSVDWFEGSDQRETIDLVAGWILMQGGIDPAALDDPQSDERVRVAALPFLYASERDGVSTGALFRVENEDGEETVVDSSIAEQVIASDEDGEVQAGDDVNANWHYTSVNNFQDRNEHLAADGRIYLPKDMRIQDDGNGHVALVDRDASVWTGWEKTKFGLDIASGVVAFAGGVMLTPVTGGASLAGAAMFVGGTGWQIYSSVEDLQNMQSHGQSIGWGNGQARRAWMDIAGSASSLVTAPISGTGRLATAARVLNVGDDAIGIDLMAEQAWGMSQGWGSMSWNERAEAFGSFASGATMMVTGPSVTSRYRNWVQGRHAPAGPSAGQLSEANAMGRPPHPLRDQIEARAYELWEAAGHPDGQDTAHWLQAEAEALRPEIDARAYEIWEQEGRPDGRDVDHWTQAEVDVRARYATYDLQATAWHMIEFLDMGDLSERDFSDLTSEQRAYLTIPQMRTVTADQLAALSADQLAEFSIDQRNALLPEQLRLLNDDQLRALNRHAQKTYLGDVPTDQPISLFGIEPTEDNPFAYQSRDLRGLSNRALRAIPPDELGQLHPFAIGSLAPEQIAALTPEQLAALPREHLGWLTAEHMAALTSQQLAALDVRQLGGFLPHQRRALTDAQKVDLTAAQMQALESPWILSPYGPVSVLANIGGGGTLIGIPEAMNSSLVNEGVMMFPGRGVRTFESHLGVEMATFALMGRERVVLLTGFNVDKGLPETDGPPGVAILAHKLIQLGIEVTCVTDGVNAPILRSSLEAIGAPTDIVRVFDASPDTAPAQARELIQDFGPDAVMAVELPGRNGQGDKRNMRGVLLNAFSGEGDQILIEAGDGGILTLAVGDGGNEAGMGPVAGLIPPAMNGEDMASIVHSDVLVTASVSNWGAIAVAAALAKSMGREDVIPTPDEYRAALTASADAGAVDGVTREQVPSADGFTVEAHMGWALDLAARINEQGHFQPILLGVFDSSSGGLHAAATLAEHMRDITGQPVLRVLALDHGNAPYGQYLGDLDHIGTITNHGLRVLDEMFRGSTSPTAIVMACNTACIGRGFANGIETPVINLVEGTADKMIELGGRHVVSLSTTPTEISGAYGARFREGTRGNFLSRNLLKGGRREITEIGASSPHDPDLDLADLVNRLNGDNRPSDETIAAAVSHYVDQMPDDTSSIWLTCTHYPALIDQIREAVANRAWTGEVPQVIDPMPFQAEAVARELGLKVERHRRPGHLRALPPLVISTADGPNSTTSREEVKADVEATLGRTNTQLQFRRNFEDLWGDSDQINSLQLSMYRPTNPASGVLYVLRTKDAQGNLVSIETLIREAEYDFYKDLVEGGVDVQRMFENALRAIGGFEPLGPPNDGIPLRSDGSPYLLYPDGPEGTAQRDTSRDQADGPPDTLETGQSDEGGRRIPWRDRARGALIEHGPLAGTSITLAATIPPQYLAVANGVSWVVRGIATLPLALAPQRFAPDTSLGRWTRGIIATSFVGNAAYHGWTYASGAGTPFNQLYAVSDQGFMAQNAHDARVGRAEGLRNWAKYTTLAASNAANALLLPLYSLPAGPQAWIPNLLFGGATAYMTGRAVLVDRAAARGQDVPAHPIRIRVALGAAALGLASFGVHYLHDNALPKLDAAAVEGTYEVIDVPTDGIEISDSQIRPT